MNFLSRDVTPVPKELRTLSANDLRSLRAALPKPQLPNDALHAAVMVGINMVLLKLEEGWEL